MTALFTLKSAINQGKINSLIAMLVLVPAVFPHIALANQTSQDKTALVFKIKDPSVLLQNSDSSDENQTLLTFDEITSNNPLATSLQKYLEDHNSPLAPYAPEMIKQPQWQRALSISWVESNFCIHNVNNNCSGIGGAPGQSTWRKYPTVFEWFKDMSALMETPRYKYTYTTFEKMNKVYVQPGSANWVLGSNQKYRELMALTSDAEQEKIANANSSTITASIPTFPELAIAK